MTGCNSVLRIFLASLWLGMALLLCQCQGRMSSLRRTSPDAEVIIAETFLTERRRVDNVDSPAVWHGPGGRHWLVSTAKSAHQLLVHDAANGKLIRRVGNPGYPGGPVRATPTASS